MAGRNRERTGHKDSEGKGVSSRGERGGIGLAGSYLVRRRIFTALAAAVGGIGLVLIFTSVRNQPGFDVALTAADTARPFYTVKVLQIPASARDDGERIMTHPEVRALAAGNELFFTQIGDEDIALCVGTFPSAESVSMREVVERFRNFKFNGKRIFESASVHQCSP